MVREREPQNVNGKESAVDPQREWQKAKRLTQTLQDSGATELLMQLCEKINADPKLSEPVRGERPSLYNFIQMEDDRSVLLARADREAQSFIGNVGDNTKFHPSTLFLRSMHRLGSALPFATSQMFYNPREVEVTRISHFK